MNEEENKVGLLKVEHEFHELAQIKIIYLTNLLGNKTRKSALSVAKEDLTVLQKFGFRTLFKMSAEKKHLITNQKFVHLSYVDLNK